MKVIVEEFGGSFEIVLDAETVAEAAVLVRLGINHTKACRLLRTYAYKEDRGVRSCLVFGKQRAATDSVPRAKSR